MKLINYNYGFVQRFECCIRGKIVVTKKEWEKIIAFCRSKLLESNYTGLTFEKDIRRQVHSIEGELYNIRVEATEWVIKKWKLPKYRRANYMFLVLNYK